MPRAYSLDLRERVARFVNAGHSRHAAAARERAEAADAKAEGRKICVELLRELGVSVRATSAPADRR
jgi:hypothetical protein